MLVDFSDGKLSLGNIFTTATRKAQGNQGVLDNFNSIDNLSSYFDNDKLNWKKLTDKIGEVDVVTKRYLNDCIDLDTQTIKNKASIEDLANAYKQSGHSLEGFISGLKGVATNMAVTLAVSLAIKGAMYIWDKLNVTYEEQAKIVSDLNDEIKSLEEEEQKLLGLRDEGGLTEAEQSRLNYLQERLALDKEIYKQEQKKLAESELYGKGDLLSDGILGNTTGDSQVANSAEKYYSTLAYIRREENKQKSYSSSANMYYKSGDSFLADYYSNKAEKSVEKLKEYKSTLLDVKKEYLDYADTIKKYSDAGVWEDDPVEQAKMDALYQEYLDMADKISADIIDVNLKLNIIDVDDIKEKIKKKFGGGLFKKVDKGYDQEFVDNLTDEEARAVELAMEKGADSYNEAIQAVYDLRNAEEDLQDTHEQTVSSYISGVSSIATDLNKLKEIYADVQDGGDFNFSSIIDNDFVDKFSSFTDEYENFVQTVANSPDDISKCQEAFDALATVYIYSKDELKNVTEETKDATIAMLEQEGVANASEVVNYQLAKAQAAVVASTLDMSKGIDYNMSVMKDALSVYDLTESEVAELANAFVNAQNYMSEAMSLGASTRIQLAASELETIQTVADAYNLMAGKYSKSIGGGTADQIKRSLNTAKRSGSKLGKQYEAVLNLGEAREAIGKLQVKIKNFGGTGISTSGGGSSKTEPYKAEIDALQDYLDAYEKAQRKREQIDKKYDNAKTTAEKIDLMQQRIDAMREEQKAIEALNDARDKEIQKNVETLRAQQFDISYDPTTDELQIKNIEHLNELKGENQEKTNKLIQDTEEMINTTKEMADANKDLADTWQDNVYTLRSYADELLDLQETLHDEKITDIEFKIDVADELNRVEDKIDGLTEKITQTIDDLNKAYAMGLDNTSDYVQSLIK